MHAAYTMIVSEFEKSGVSLWAAIERADESLLPEAEQRAAANRRAYAHLLSAAEGGTTASRLGVRKS